MEFLLVSYKQGLVAESHVASRHAGIGSLFFSACPKTEASFYVDERYSRIWEDQL